MSRMCPGPFRRPAVMLMLALVGMFVVTLFTGIVVRALAQASSTRQMAAAQRTARLVAASVAEWAARQPDLETQARSGPPSVDIADLVPSGASASVAIECSAEGSARCTVVARAWAGRHAARATVAVSPAE